MGCVMLPYLNEIKTNRTVVLDFKGYNHNQSINDGEFFNMQNLSSSFYPVLSLRKPRGTVQELTSPKGLFAKNKLAWVDGTSFVYDSKTKGQVENSEKKFVSIGAYILIFPDKKYYNISSGEFGSLESSYNTTSSVTVIGCQLDGTPISPASYIKITAPDIDDSFNQYDGVLITGTESIDGPAIISNIGSDYIIIANSSGYEGTLSGVTIKRSVPDMDFITENGNRVWGCSSTNHEVYASKLGDPFNWNCFEGISTDSYAATIGSDGDFTGVTTFGGYVLFFKEDIIHKVYGDKPSNFQIYENVCRGVAKGSEKSLVTVNETLYYLSRNGVMAYAGSIPENISGPLGQEVYKNGVAGAFKNKYYISLEDSTKSNHLFCYDESLGMWHREDDTKVLYFASLDGMLYYITGDKLMTVEGADKSTVQWYGEFGDFTEKTIYKKYVMKLQLILELTEGASFNVYISYDGGAWSSSLAIITQAGKRSYLIPINIKRCDYYKIKLGGTGDFKLHAMAKVYSEGSDI